MDFASFDTPMLAGAVIMTVAFLAGLSQGRDIWLLVDFIITAVFGLTLYLTPHIILKVELSLVPDGTHLTFTRAFGALMIGDAVTRYFCRSSKDNSTQVFLLLSRVIGCAVLLIAMFYIQNTGNNILNQNHIIFGILGNLLWMMGSVVYYIQSRYSGGHAQLDSQLNFHLRMDGFVCLIGAVAMYAFPEVFVSFMTNQEQLDGAHMHMTRCIGALAVSSAMLFFFAPGFLFEEDKRAVLLGRIVKVVITTLAVFYAAASYDGWGKNLHLYLLMETCMMLNALLGYYAPHETDRYKSS